MKRRKNNYYVCNSCKSRKIRKIINYPFGRNSKKRVKLRCKRCGSANIKLKVE